MAEQEADPSALVCSTCGYEASSIRGLNIHITKNAPGHIGINSRIPTSQANPEILQMKMLVHGQLSQNQKLADTNMEGKMILTRRTPVHPKASRAHWRHL